MGITEEEEMILKSINAIFLNDECSRSIISGFIISLIGATRTGHRREFILKMAEIVEYICDLDNIGTPPTIRRNEVWKQYVNVICVE